ncbi:GNAT family N-acetyltransferase [Cyanobium sp. CH-040]|uniref:GNAT family N-acetyltransferase n=1 Tax=Cyanobium sp. CH-040 TaxID=2823708 RepID=UPI0020CE7253|nr:GNAT family N-acetyltransferase [Cyanobium sp. CH-040]MCP9928030.1 GNAT family N-acetyltransferase [Cyanobium sp. CH-040]
MPIVKAADGNPLNLSAAIALPAQRIERDLAPFLLFTSQGLNLYLLPGERFSPFAEAVGELRELTYRQQLSGSGKSRDLDSRDPHYDHFLLVEASSGELAGSARLQFVPSRSSEPGPVQGAGLEQPPLPGSGESYLEHVYPGIKAALASAGHHLEIGRVALAPRFQRLPHSLMFLFRGGLQVAVASGYGSIHGLVSYNHFAYADAVNEEFLSALLRPPFLDPTAPCPEPRHPVAGLEPDLSPATVDSIQALERHIQTHLDPGFRLPVLLRQYINLMEARVRNLSLARDFNQITEILMAADLSRIPARRLQHFIDFPHRPIYRNFSWYRGGINGRP